MRYIQNCRELLVKDDQGNFVWKGRPTNQDVMAIHVVPDSQDCIILCKKDDLGSNSRVNLHRCTDSGKVVWSAEFPFDIAKDWYVEFRIDEDGLSAFTCSCFCVWINMETGRILKKVFTK